MHRLQSYIARTVAAAILLCLAVIVGLDVVAALIDQLGDLRGDYRFGNALLYVAMTVPGRIYEYLPFAALLGCLLGMGSLASTSELVVMRSAGVSMRRMVWMVMRPALLIVLLGLALAEFVAPKLQQLADSYRALALQKENQVLNRYGLWHREGEQFIHFNAVQPNGVLIGVAMFSFDEQGALASSSFAHQAIYQGDSWLLEDVREVRFVDGRSEATHQSYRDWYTELNPELLNILVLKPQDLPISGLWRYGHYLREQGVNGDEYFLAFWSKLLQPLTVVTLVLVALSFIFGPLRQVTMGFRIFVGVMVGVVFRSLQDMLGPMALVYDFAPIMASLLPIVVGSSLGLYLLMRRV